MCTNSACVTQRPVQLVANGRQRHAVSVVLHFQNSPGITDLHDQVHLPQLFLQIALSFCNVSRVPLHHARLHRGSTM